MEGRYYYCAVCRMQMPDVPTTSFVCEPCLAKNQPASPTSEARAPRYFFCAVGGTDMPDSPTRNYVCEECLANNQPEAR